MNFAIMRSGFGDLWIGGTNLVANGKTIFGNFDDALEEAKSLNDSITNGIELDDTKEEDIELLSLDMERWIIS